MDQLTAVSNALEYAKAHSYNVVHYTRVTELLVAKGASSALGVTIKVLLANYPFVGNDAIAYLTINVYDNGYTEIAGIKRAVVDPKLLTQV